MEIIVISSEPRVVHAIDVQDNQFVLIGSWWFQIKDRRPEEALAFGRDFLGSAVKTSNEQSLLQVIQCRQIALSLLCSK